MKGKRHSPHAVSLKSGGLVHEVAAGVLIVLAALLIIALALILFAWPARAVDFSTCPQAPADPMQNPGNWTVGVWQQWTPAQRNNFAVGFWTGLYVVKVLLNDPDMDWRHFCAWLDFETGKDTDQLQEQVAAWGRVHGRGALILDGLTDEGLRRGDSPGNVYRGLPR